MNKFEVSGPVVSYGTTKGHDWIDVLTYEGSITIYLDEKLSLYELESKLDADDAYAVVEGYIQPFKYTENVAVVATSVEVQ